MADIEDDKFENKSFVAERFFSESFILKSNTDYENKIISIVSESDISDIILDFPDVFQANTPFTISGKHNFSIFTNVKLTHIPKGSSDLIDTPIITNSFSNIDKNTRQVIEYMPQTTPEYVTFRINYEEISEGG